MHMQPPLPPRLACHSCGPTPPSPGCSSWWAPTKWQVKWQPQRAPLMQRPNLGAGVGLRRLCCVRWRHQPPLWWLPWPEHGEHTQQRCNACLLMCRAASSSMSDQLCSQLCVRYWCALLDACGHNLRPKGHTCLCTRAAPLRPLCGTDPPLLYQDPHQATCTLLPCLQLPSGLKSQPAFSPVVPSKTQVPSQQKQSPSLPRSVANSGKAARSQRSRAAGTPTFTALLFQDSPDSLGSRSPASTPAAMVRPQLRAAELSPRPLALFGDSPASLGSRDPLPGWAQTSPGRHPVSHAHSLLAAGHPHGDVGGTHHSGSCPVCLVSASDQQLTPAMLPVQVSSAASPASRTAPLTPGTCGSVDFSGMTPSVASRGRAALAHQRAQEVRPPAAQHGLRCTAGLAGRSGTSCSWCLNLRSGVGCVVKPRACLPGATANAAAGLQS